MPVTVFFAREGDPAAQIVEAIARLTPGAQPLLILGRVALAEKICALAKRRPIARLIASSWSLHPETVSLFREAAEAGRIREATVHIGTIKAREAVEYADAVLPKNFLVCRTKSHMKLAIVRFFDGAAIAFHGSANLQDDTDAQHCFVSAEPGIIAAIEAALAAVETSDMRAEEGTQSLEMDWL